MTGSHIETEAKWRVDDAGGHARMRGALRRLGASHESTGDETNTLLDTADESLRHDGRVLRLRAFGDGRSVLTFKGPATYRHGIKSREEVESTVDDCEAMLRILDGLGYRPSLKYHKTRETWRIDGAVVALDTLDFGCFVEIEGDDDASVRRIAGQLGLAQTAALENGYPSLMRAHLARRG